MELSRECYLIYLKHSNVVNRVKKIKNLDVYYISKRSLYLTVYFDSKDKAKILEELKKIKGVDSFEKTHLEMPDVKISL